MTTLAPARITGRAALACARNHGVTINAYASPVEEAAEDIGLDRACEIAREDARLLYVDVSDSMIEALYGEAGQAGDILQAAICQRALGAADLGDYPLSAEERARVALMTVKAARRECASVIEAAQA